MRLKYYLRGAGVGVVITTLILVIAFAFHQPSISDDEIIRRAKLLGMVMEEEQPLEAEDQKPEEISEVSVLEESSIDNSKVDEAEVNAIDANEEDAVEAVSDEPKTEDESDNKTSVSEVYVKFTVHAGESSNTVASNLVKQGLVDDENKFNQFLDGNGYSRSIQAGSFYIKQGASYEEIGKLLITKQSEREGKPEFKDE